MFGKGITAFRLLGIPVGIDASWILPAILMVWSLVTGAFPTMDGALAGQPRWTMAIIGAAGIIASVILHELAHAVVARWNGIPISRITLFVFGGVAEMEQDPPGPRAEFRMAIAGPLLSIALGIALLAVASAGGFAGLSRPFVVLSAYLGWMNLILAGFNLVPGFPLDGGRVLRSLLWVWKDDYLRATRIATAVGSGFAVTLILAGVWIALAGSPVGGIWWLMVGFLLNNASQLSYRHALVRHALKGEQVSGVMLDTPVAVAPGTSLRSVVDDCFYRHHFQSFPVVSGGRLLGSVGTREIKRVPRREWSARTVGEILVPCGPDCIIGPKESALRALTAMNRGGLGRLLVVDQGKLVGIVTLADLFRLVAVKLDLEEADRAPREALPPPLPVFWSGRPARH
jgi:Zn-dependent protease/CBS domain-containing protein